MDALDAVKLNLQYSMKFYMALSYMEGEGRQNYCYKESV